ncbi:AsmA-like C-terminal region-containing protein [Reichenbachiella sp. MALMAid0571]|uniref:AsmA-like C-terminal region-containing protein n=1 Tax=Reichenbachiella sp. MALMAid0571 TaxID=3143939 RepID=UPI0032DF89A7
MKKFLVIIGSLIGVLILAMILIPIIFKDDIKKAVDDAMADNLNANVFYDPDGINLTLFSNFPDFTFGMDDFGISGIGKFEGDTLVSVGSFEVVIDVMSVISGDKITISSITLDEPKILVKVLKDGSANYDIAKTTEDTAVEETPENAEASAFSIGINKWEIVNGSLDYIDESMAFTTSLKGLNHTGSGDFALDIFDMITKTTVDDFSLGYEGVEYMSRKTLDIDMIMSMDLANAKYTFKENTVKLNDFGFGFDGYVSMPDEDIDMDITYSGKEISMKSILSLIPGDYQSYLDGVTAGGEVNFDGFVRGKYNETLLPTVNTKLGIKNGSIRYAEYPIPMEKINVATELNVPGENMNAMSFDMSKFHMLVDGEEVSATMSFKNLDNYTWAFSLLGNLDLEKILKIVPIEGTQLKGKIKADFKTSGNMALVEAEKYDQLPASGNMSIDGFYFSSPDLPQGFGITSSKMSFNPKYITLTNFDGTIGKSDIHMDGNIQNYIGFALDSTEVLTGQLNFSSNSFDLNEWMVEEETVETESGEDSLALEVVRIPVNIDFVMNASMKKIIYDNLNIENLKGNIVIKDGAARMQGVDFDMLKGKFTMSGSYVTANVENPEFDFMFGIKGLSIPASFEAFNTVQQLAPIAKNVNGNFSTDFKIGGVLGPDMMPVYDKLFGSGLIQIADAALSGSKITSAISTVTKLKGGSGETEGVKLKDVIMDAEIKDGRLHVKPFDVSIGGYKTTVSGSNGILGDLDYKLKMDVPSGAAGAALNSALSSFTGGKSIVGENIKLNLGLQGTYDDPKVGLLGTESGEGGAGSTAKAAAKAALDEQKAKAQAELDKKKAEAEAKAKAELEKKKKEAEEKAKAEAEKLKQDAADKAKDAIKGLFKKK